MPGNLIDAFTYVISFISYDTQGTLHNLHFAVGQNEAQGVCGLLEDYLTTRSWGWKLDRSLQTWCSADITVLNAKPHMWLFTLPSLLPKQLIIAASADTYRKHPFHFPFILCHSFSIQSFICVCECGCTLTAKDAAKMSVWHF